MPEQAALIAFLIVERPLCLESISAKSGMCAASSATSPQSPARRRLP